MATTPSAHNDRNIERHKKYLADVPPAKVRETLRRFHLDEQVMAVESIICETIEIAHPFGEYAKWIHQLKPKTLDDLKLWIGIPNDIAKQMLENARQRGVGSDGRLWSGITDSIPRKLPKREKYTLESLDREQQQELLQTANNMLYGYVDPQAVAEPPLSLVAEFMLTEARKRGIFTLVVPNLIICSDKVVTFNNVASLVFNNILIYGNGQLLTRGKTKIYAQQIRHV